MCVIIAVVIITFIVLYIIPGSAALTLLGNHADATNVAALTEKLGLDRPFGAQLVDYLQSIFSGNLGVSIISGNSVLDEILQAFPNTIKLAVMAALFAWIIGIGGAIIASVRRKSIIDKLFNSCSVLGISLPVFMVALCLQYFIAYRLGLMNLISDNKGFSAYILPAIALGISNAGEIFLISRTAIEQTLNEDYALISRSRGASSVYIVFRHSLRNASFSIISVMAMQISSLLSGAVITESIFAINGIGRLAVDAIYARDITLIRGVVLFTATIVVLGNLIADVISSAIGRRTERGSLA